MAGMPDAPPSCHHGRTQPTTMTTPATAASVRPRPSGRRCIVIPGDPRVDLRLEDANDAQVPVELAVVEAVADDELVRDREADVVDRDLDEPPGRLVEQRADAQRARVLAAQVADQVVEGEAGVDDVLDDEDVASVDARREVLEDPDQARRLGRRPAVRGDLHEVDPDRDVIARIRSAMNGSEPLSTLTSVSSRPA